MFILWEIGSSDFSSVAHNMNMKMGQKFAHEEKSNCLPDCVIKNVDNRSWGLTILIYLTLVRPHLQYCNPVLGFLK